MGFHLKFVIGDVDVQIKIRDVSPGCGMSKFDGFMHRVEVVDEIVQFCLRMFPDKEDVI